MQKILDWTLAGIRRIPAALDSFVAHMNYDLFLIVIKYLNFATFSKDLCYGFSLLSAARRGGPVGYTRTNKYVTQSWTDLTVSGDCFVNILIDGGLTQKVQYHLHEGIQVVAVLSQMNLTRTVLSYIFEHPL